MKKYIIGFVIGIISTIVIETLSLYIAFKYYTKHIENEVAAPPAFFREQKFEGIIKISDEESIELGKGNIIIINKWATWCSPCVSELPSLEELRKKTLSKGVKVLCITDEKIDISNWKKKRNLEAPLYKNVDLPFDMNAKAIPLTWVIDGNGILKASYTGRADWSHQSFIDYLKTLDGWKEDRTSQ